MQNSLVNCYSISGIRSFAQSIIFFLIWEHFLFFMLYFTCFQDDFAKMWQTEGTQSWKFGELPFYYLGRLPLHLALLADQILLQYLKVPRREWFDTWFAHILSPITKKQSQRHKMVVIFSWRVRYVSRKGSLMSAPLKT